MPPFPSITGVTENIIIQRGFGRFVLDKDLAVYDEKLPRYPPPPNAAYKNPVDKVDWSKKIWFEPQLDGATFVTDNTLARRTEDKRLEVTRLERETTRTIGELAAEKIDWGRRLCNGGDFTESSSLVVSTSSWRRDFVKNIDDAIAAGKEPFSICNKCKKRHIPWGPPIAMQDLDTCRSMIPDWFPMEDLNNPWNSFIGLVDELVKCAEVEQGLAGDAGGPLRGNEFHEQSQEWEALGRHGGWWKCRSSNEEGEEQVPIAEKECTLCHRPRTGEELEAEAVVKKGTRRREVIDKWIGKCMKDQVEKDKSAEAARFWHDL